MARKKTRSHSQLHAELYEQCLAQGGRRKTKMCERVANAGVRLAEAQEKAGLGGAIQLTPPSSARAMGALHATAPARPLRGHPIHKRPTRPVEGVELLEIEELSLDSGGYDPRGRYFGVGEPVFEYQDEYSEVVGRVRAPSRAAVHRTLAERYPGARLVDVDDEDGGGGLAGAGARFIDTIRGGR